MTLKEKFDKCKDAKNQYYVIPISDDSKQLVKIAEDFAIGFAEWLDTLKPNQRVSFWSKNGEGKGVFNMDNEQLLEIYKKEKGL
jgi:hypothetical protein